MDATDPPNTSLKAFPALPPTQNLPVFSSPSAQIQPLEGESKKSAKSSVFRVEEKNRRFSAGERRETEHRAARNPANDGLGEEEAENVRWCRCWCWWCWRQVLKRCLDVAFILDFGNRRDVSGNQVNKFIIHRINLDPPMTNAIFSTSILIHLINRIQKSDRQPINTHDTCDRHFIFLPQQLRYQRHHPFLPYNHKHDQHPPHAHPPHPFPSLSTLCRHNTENQAQ